MIEGKEIHSFVADVWEQMQKTIKDGISKTGVIHGRLGVQKKAKHLYNQHHIDETTETRENRMVASFAFAVGEENACGETIVTAPTCGASGVVPAVMYYYKKKRDFSDSDIIHALETAALIGNLVKTNASISGAECGCQAEIGTACMMASAALGELFEMGIDQIEYAAEIAMEHHLGLTCDPICGLVQIPCIERNAVAAMRAINAMSLANFLSGSRKISFDLVVKTMYETGKDLSHIYRETSEGGLAKHYKKVT
jgi:L-serine dehydratase